jgi:uncharacterized protein (TIGR02391 family)
MRWDDVELLRLIDDLEESEAGVLGNGLGLMQRGAADEILDPNRDYAAFAHELLLARGAGFIVFDERGVWPPNADPLSNPNSWLQQIRDIRLTLAGRDRARGRIVMRPLPDPDEDDDRPIAGMTLEEIARAVGDAYTGGQLPRFLLDSGIPDEFLLGQVSGSKWTYVLDVFERLHDGGSAARRALREFIGSWLENRLHTGPRDEVRERVVAQLARQGWFVQDSRLIIGELQVTQVPAAPPIGRDARIAALHPNVRRVAERYLESGHMEVAIFEAFKAVNKRVKELTGLEADGSDLMAKAFRDDSAPIQLGDNSTRTGRDIQAGFRFMFMGAVLGIRNPDAHELFVPLDGEEALEKLAFASMLMRRLDESQPK